MNAPLRIHPGIGFKAGRLWSLWDMLRFYSEKFLKAHHSMRQLEYASDESRTGKLKGMSGGVEAGILKELDDLIPLLKELGLEFSHKIASELRAYFDQNRNLAALGMAGDLARRIHDELESRYCYMITAHEQRLLDPDTPLFGMNVDWVFTRAAEDISEAGKCLALGRYTASVFHLMRVLETAVLSLGSKLQVTVIDADNKDLEWGKILGNIGDKLKTLPKGELKDRWSENHSLLFHVKQAWRNPTMHPKQTYTEEEATSIFNAVRSFMIHLVPLV